MNTSHASRLPDKAADAKQSSAQKRIHLPAKMVGDNFYPAMYGMTRAFRLRTMAEARLTRGARRSEFVQKARKLNHECVWYLRRTTERSLP